MADLGREEKRLMKRFAKAKGLPLPVRVLGGVRRVYLIPERIRVVTARTLRQEETMAACGNLMVGSIGLNTLLRGYKRSPHGVV